MIASEGLAAGGVEVLSPPDEDWPGPPAYLPPPSPELREDGVRHYRGVDSAMPMGYRPLKLELWVPPGPTESGGGAAAPPLVVWVHGGGWLFGDRLVLPETMRPGQVWEDALTRGLAVASVDYRHSLEASFPAQLHDVKAAVRYLRAHAETLGVDASRVGVWGESAGGHLACLVGLTGDADAALEGALGITGVSSAVSAVVDWYAPTDFTVPGRTLGPPGSTDPVWELTPGEHLVRTSTPQMRAAVSPVTHVAAGAPPFLVIHGTADSVVPYEQSEILVRALGEAGVPISLVPVEGAEHIFGPTFGFHPDVDGIVRRSLDFLTEELTR